ncbi:MAG: hypothetical protein WBD71_05900 [Xanthobacteraceae bacterium]
MVADPVAAPDWAAAGSPDGVAVCAAAGRLAASMIVTIADVEIRKNENVKMRPGLGPRLLTGNTLRLNGEERTRHRDFG